MNKCKLKLFVLIIFVVLQIVSQVVIVGYVATAVEYAMASINNGVGNDIIYNKLFKDSVILLVIDLFSALTAIVVGYFAAEISSKVAYDIREKIFNKVMSFSLEEFDKFSISTLINRSINDIKIVQDVLYLFLITALQSPIYVVVGLFFIVNKKSGLTYIVLMVVIILLLIVVFIVYKVLPLSKQLQKKVDVLNLVSRESLKGVNDIRAYNRESWSYDRNVKVCEELKDINIKYNSVMTMLFPTMNFFWSIISVIVIYAGINKVINNIITVGDLLGVASYAILIITGFLLLATVVMQVPRAISSLKRIEEIVYAKNIIIDGNICNDEKIDSIIFNNVSFKYNIDGGNVLQDINMEFKKGKTYAIIGETGAGKSTIVKLIERLYDVSKGEILINNKNIKDYNISNLRGMIAYVPQNKYLFTKTVKENIVISSKIEVPMEVVEKATKLSRADEFINDKSKKYDEILSKNGSNYSGGQKQRLTIARAFVEDKDVYMLDDSYSALDSLTAKKIKDALREKNKNSIMVIISQRVSQIQDADEIFVIEKGKIVGFGNHNELAEKCEVYKEILKSQEMLL